jgi:hypothetical protein
MSRDYDKHIWTRRAGTGAILGSATTYAIRVVKVGNASFIRHDSTGEELCNRAKEGRDGKGRQGMKHAEPEARAGLVGRWFLGRLACKCHGRYSGPRGDPFLPLTPEYLNDSARPPLPNARFENEREGGRRATIRYPKTVAPGALPSRRMVVAMKRHNGSTSEQARKHRDCRIATEQLSLLSEFATDIASCENHDRTYESPS